MKTVVVLCLAVAPALCQVTPVSETNLAANLPYEGTIRDAFVVTDKNGPTTILVTETPIRPSKTWADSRETELFVYRYLAQNSDQKKVLWRVYDFVKECPVDLEATFLGGKETKGVTVTDLDGDNDSEIWIAYRLACRGDVSPATVKLVMYEGKTKYALRGTSKVKVSDTEYAGGKFEFDKTFQAGPQSFRDYAQAMWDQVVAE